MKWRHSVFGELPSVDLAGFAGMSIECNDVDFPAKLPGSTKAVPEVRNASHELSSTSCWFELSSNT